MAETVFILGAGASAAMGTPLLANFFDVARKLATESTEPAFKQALEDFTAVHVVLQRTAAKTHIDLYNLESVWTCFEMAEVLGGLPAGAGLEEVSKARKGLEYLIAKTLMGSMSLAWARPLSIGRHPTDNDGIRFPCPAHYLTFINTLPLLLEKAKAAFLTFNYDLGLDLALSCAGYEIEYALRPRASTNGIPLLKLHGSLGWMNSGESIEPWPMTIGAVTEDFTQIVSSRLDANASLQSKWRRCFDAPGSMKPYIVPPGDSKLSARQRLKTVWTRAAQELQQARRIVIIGFSLPPTDEFFRNLLGLGTISDSLLERIIVIDPNESSRHRLRDILSRQSQTRFRELARTFDDAFIRSIEWQDLVIRELS